LTITTFAAMETIPEKTQATLIDTLSYQHNTKRMMMPMQPQMPLSRNWPNG
jgi:uncharacterized protein YbaP (TraB family)